MGNKYENTHGTFNRRKVEYRKCGCLPDIRNNSPCQLGTLIPESFSERMINVVNILAGMHRIRLDHYNIDKMVICV